MIEVTPADLNERTKLYGDICSNCAQGIQAWDKSVKKLDCLFHEDHFRCHGCDVKLDEGTYVAYQGLPYCHKCYTAVNPKPQCKRCNNAISKEYVIALGAYWHQKCFSCKNCSKRPLPSTPLFAYKDNPYCATCHKKLTG